MRAGVLAALALALCGCTSSGTRFDPSRLDEVRTGQTTYDEIVRRYGRPNFGSTAWDGSRTAVYVPSNGRSDAELLLPAVGAALSAGGGVESVTFRFDEKGVLTDFRRARPASEAGRAGGTGPATPGAAGPAQGGVASPPTASSEALPGSAAVRPAPMRPAAARPPDSDALPWWLPSRNYDPRQ